MELDKLNRKLHDIHEALENRDEQRAFDLMDDDDVRGHTDYAGGWLHYAADFGLIELARRLIGAGFNVDTRSGWANGTPLNSGAAKGKAGILELLLSHGARIESDEPERNPLYSAIQMGHLDIVQFLVEHGADMAISYSGKLWTEMTPLRYAKVMQKPEIHAWLQEYYDTHPGVLGTNHIS